jgi:hypothetical protein
MRASVALVLGLALTVAGGCGGEKLRLGDGFGTDVNTAGGGSAGQSGGTGGTPEPPAFAGEGGAPSGAGSPAGGAGGDVGCERGQVEPNEVVWIGDSWITLPGTQYQRVNELALEADALAPGEEYARVAAAGAYIDDVREQYVQRQAGSPKIKVLIMDGGTFDTVQRGTGDDVILHVLESFAELLGQIATDGTVEHIVYFLQPDLIAGVARLRPELMRLCAESVVPCHFINLQDFWVDDYSFLTIQASEAGGTAIGEAIWAVMQDNCIAQ